jgi:hypothetical protein
MRHLVVQISADVVRHDNRDLFASGMPARRAVARSLQSCKVVVRGDDDALDAIQQRQRGQVARVNSGPYRRESMCQRQRSLDALSCRSEALQIQGTQTASRGRVLDSRDDGALGQVH